MSDQRPDSASARLQQLVGSRARARDEAEEAGRQAEEAARQQQAAMEVAAAQEAAVVAERFASLLVEIPSIALTASGAGVRPDLIHKGANYWVVGAGECKKVGLYSAHYSSYEMKSHGSSGGDCDDFGWEGTVLNSVGCLYICVLSRIEAGSGSAPFRDGIAKYIASHGPHQKVKKLERLRSTDLRTPAAVTQLESDIADFVVAHRLEKKVCMNAQGHDPGPAAAKRASQIMDGLPQIATRARCEGVEPSVIHRAHPATQGRSRLVTVREPGLFGFTRRKQVPNAALSSDGALETSYWVLGCGKRKRVGSCSVTAPSHGMKEGAGTSKAGDLGWEGFLLDTQGRLVACVLSRATTFNEVGIRALRESSGTAYVVPWASEHVVKSLQVLRTTDFTSSSAVEQLESDVASFVISNHLD